MPYRKPGASELVLASLVARALDVESVERDDDFFALGGDTARLERLVASIDARLGVTVSPDLVRAYPTPRALALQIRTHRPRGSPTVVALRDHGSLAPVCCFTGGGAPATRLRALADALPGRPFYGIQARGLEEHAVPDYTVERIARRALEEISDVRLPGPYVIAGHSCGTLPALELACLLEAEGKTVELLVLMDTVAPQWASSREMRRRARLGMSRPSTPPSLSAQLHSMTQATKVAIARSGRNISRLTTGMVPRPGLYQQDQFFGFSLWVCRRYAPRRGFGGRALVVRCADPILFDDPKRADGDFGWGSWVRGPIRTVVTSADHLSMMDAPDVNTVGALIEEAIAAEW